MFLLGAEQLFSFLCIKWCWVQFIHRALIPKPLETAQRARNMLENIKM